MKLCPDDDDGNVWMNLGALQPADERVVRRFLSGWCACYLTSTCRVILMGALLH